MKRFAFIINFYILLLPLLPCADTEECDEKGKLEWVSGNDHGQHDDEEEACTPFCFCACCSATVFMEPGMIEYASAQAGFPPEAKYLPSFYSFNFNFIWQPPKIG